MNLEFAGQLSPWWGLALAAAFAVGTWLLYRRETKRAARFPFLLPLLRVIVVALVILMLTGPTLRATSNVGDPGRVIVFVDASQSMAMTDPHMEIARKLLIARGRGWIEGSVINTSLYDAAESLRDARLNVEDAIGGKDRLDLPALSRRFQQQLGKLHGELGKLDLDALPSARSVQTGTILREYWLDLPGDRLTDLTDDPRFTGPPTGTHSPDGFEAPPNLGDNYGTRLRGYLHPPVDGAYVFWISSDGPSELWISTSEDPGGKRRIASVTAATKRREWKSGETQSQPVQLIGGRRYYVEALHKEGTGDDHLAVGWQLPVGSVERPIPGRRLSPFAVITGESAGEQRDAIVSSFKSELLAPLDALIARPDDTDAARLKKSADLVALASIVSRWETTLKSAFESHTRSLVERGDPSIAASLTKVDESQRWQRLNAMLLADDGLVAALSARHHIEVYALREAQAELLWTAGKSSKPPASFDSQPAGQTTDLSAGLRDRVSSPGGGTANASTPSADEVGHTSVILLSDGQHNVEAANPQAVAAILGERRIPLYTVGLGSLTRPEDISVRSVEGPQSVFHEDRVSGEIVLDDDMPAGKPFTVRIELGDKTVWEKRLVTERTNIRRVPFDFAIKELVEQQLKGQGRGVKLLNVPLSFKVSVSPIEGEQEKANNSGAMVVQAVTEPRRVLLIDGRPRWETRYLRNLLERDQRWQVNTLISGTNAAGAAWRRGDEKGAFPRDLQSLFKYDVIIFGDVPAGALSQVELERVRDFAGERGGGVIFIDGQRGHLRSYAQTPIRELLPIEWTGTSNAEAGVRPARLKLSAAGQASTPFRLVADPLENASLWQELQPPHWVAPVRVLPGAEVLAEAVVGEQTMPAIVQRSYGAGKVIYCGFDESWRWRYEVADVYHARFWNQLARHVGEQPYAVQDQFVRLDAGNPTYRPGEKAELRARLRDKDGRPITSGKVLARLYRDGRLAASIPMEAGDAKGGLSRGFRGQTAALEPGNYEVGLSVEGMNDADLKARAKFVVEAPISVESRAVVMDEELLKRMAERSHGRYYREEDFGQLIQRLEPMTKGRIVVTETQLWRSYWWFVPIMLLLTTEWLLRKRAGMM